MDYQWSSLIYWISECFSFLHRPATYNFSINCFSSSAPGRSLLFPRTNTWKKSFIFMLNPEAIKVYFCLWPLVGIILDLAAKYLEHSSRHIQNDQWLWEHLGNPATSQGQMLGTHALETGSNYFWVYQYQKSSLEVNLSIRDGIMGWCQIPPGGFLLHATKPGWEHAPGVLKQPTDIQSTGPD